MAPSLKQECKLSRKSKVGHVDPQPFIQGWDQGQHSRAWLGTAGQDPDSSAIRKGNAGSGPRAQGGTVLAGVSVGTQHTEQ